MQIKYSKKAVKYINSADKLTKKRLKDAIKKIPLGDIKKLKGIEDAYRLRIGDLLKNLIELIPESDIDVLYKVIIKFILETEPQPDELSALLEGKQDREENGTISHNDINWD